MKKRLILILTLMTALFSGCIYSNIPVYEDDFIVRIGDPAPDFEVELIDGRKVRLSELKGRVVLLQFTASWCKVCHREMPHIESRIWQPHKDSDRFALIGIDKEESLEDVLRFKEETGVTYPLGLDPDASIFLKYAAENAGVTRNVLIDENGIIVRVTRLFHEDEFQALVDDINRRISL